MPTYLTLRIEKGVRKGEGWCISHTNTKRTISLFENLPWEIPASPPSFIRLRGRVVTTKREREREGEDHDVNPLISLHVWFGSVWFG